MESVKEYYGKILNKTSDLKTNACCTLIKYPKHITDALSNIHEDILSSYYGCGLVIPSCLKNKIVLDLPVTNDTAERAVNKVTEYANNANDRGQRGKIVTVAAWHHNKMSGYTKEELENAF